MGIKSSIKNWVRNWLREEPEEAEQSLVIQDHSSGLSNEHNSIRFELHKAAGGVVIETRTYDKIKDRVYTKLHIITHDQDIGESLGKIITMESLRG
jgi:hypothetical protein